MPRSRNRRPIELPLHIVEAVDDLARKADIPTSTLVAKWLLQRLEAEGVHLYDPYRYTQYPRREPNTHPPVHTEQAEQDAHERYDSGWK